MNEELRRQLIEHLTKDNGFTSSTWKMLLAENQNSALYPAFITGFIDLVAIIIILVCVFKLLDPRSKANGNLDMEIGVAMIACVVMVLTTVVTCVQLSHAYSPATDTLQALLKQR